MKEKQFLKNYKPGVDLWGLVLFGLLLLPNVVYWCIPKEYHLGGSGALDIAAKVFQAISLVLLVFVVRREREKFSFSSPMIYFSSLFLLLYYIAWIFFFCGYGNAAVLLFLAGCPCVTLLLFEIWRKNWIALFPTAVFSVLHIVATVLLL